MVCFYLLCLLRSAEEYAVYSGTKVGAHTLHSKPDAAHQSMIHDSEHASALPAPSV